MSTLTAIAALLIAPVAALIALRFWMAQPRRVFAIGRSLKRWKGPQ